MSNPDKVDAVHFKYVVSTMETASLIDIHFIIVLCFDRNTVSTVL